MNMKIADFRVSGILDPNADNYAEISLKLISDTASALDEIASALSISPANAANDHEPIWSVPHVDH